MRVCLIWTAKAIRRLLRIRRGIESVVVSAGVKGRRNRSQGRVTVRADGVATAQNIPLYG